MTYFHLLGLVNLLWISSNITLLFYKCSCWTPPLEILGIRKVLVSVGILFSILVQTHFLNQTKCLKSQVTSNSQSTSAHLILSFFHVFSKGMLTDHFICQIGSQASSKMYSFISIHVQVNMSLDHPTITLFGKTMAAYYNMQYIVI